MTSVILIFCSLNVNPRIINSDPIKVKESIARI